MGSRQRRLIVVALVGGTALLQACTSRPAPEDFQTVEAERGDLTAVVGATGTVRPDQSADLMFETSGTVQDVTVDIGDEVQVDQVLATLRETSVPAAVIAAQAELVEAQRALDNLLQSGSPQAEAQLALAQAQDASRTPNTYGVSARKATAPARRRSTWHAPGW